MMRKTGITGFITALAIVLTGAVAASTNEGPNTVMIRNVTLFDATGKAPFTTDVLVSKGRISAIGANIETPVHGEDIDGNGLSMLPGLIDVHMHWTGASRAEIATQLILSGVTTAADFHSAPESYAVKREWHEKLTSPHVSYVARMSTPEGHGADWGDQNMTRIVTSAYEGKTAVEELAPFKPDVIKVFADGWRYGNPTNNANINGNTLAAIVDEAKKQGLPVVTHTVTVERAKLAAQAGVTAIVHAIQDRKLDDELITLMRENNVSYAPTLAVYEPRPDKILGSTDVQMKPVMRRQEASRYNLQRIARAGIPVALGTDSGIGSTPFGESSMRELELLVDFGLTAADALIAGTANSAAILGLKDDRGTLEVGKRADFVLVSGKPWKKIADYRKLAYVFVDGKLVAKDGKLVMPQGPTVPRIKASLAMIDDFDREDDKTVGGAIRLLDTDTGFPRSTLISQLVSRGENGNALLLSAKMARKKTPKALVSMPLTEAGFFAVDASAFSGISFDARGDGDLYLIEIESESGAVQHTFSAASDWQRVNLQFADFTSGSVNSRWTPADIYVVKIGAKRPEGETFWLELDNVGFITP